MCGKASIQSTKINSSQQTASLYHRALIGHPSMLARSFMDQAYRVDIWPSSSTLSHTLDLQKRGLIGQNCLPIEELSPSIMFAIEAIISSIYCVPAQTWGAEAQGCVFDQGSWLVPTNLLLESNFKSAAAVTKTDQQENGLKKMLRALKNNFYPANTL